MKTQMKQLDWLELPAPPVIDYPKRTRIGTEKETVNMGGYFRVTYHLYQHDTGQIDHEIADVEHLKEDQVDQLKTAMSEN